MDHATLVVTHIMSCVLLVPSASFPKFHQEDRSEHIWGFCAFHNDDVLTERLTNQMFLDSFFPLAISMA